MAVESDPQFLEAVKRKCRPDGGHFIYADLGPTGPWGVPRRRRPNAERTARWEAYPDAPWRCLGDDFRADLILVDGRFRVASALNTIIRQGDHNWTMLFDDFGDRPEYVAVTGFATLLAMHGRMAEFGPRADLDVAAAKAAYRRFISDWR